MSVIRKKPYIETQLEKLTGNQLTTLKSVMNTIGGNETYYSLIDSDDSLNTYLTNKTTEIKAIKLRLDKEHIRNGILIYNNAQQTYPLSIFITYHSYQDLSIYELDIPHSKAISIREYIDINELRRIVDLLQVNIGGTASAWELALKDNFLYNTTDEQVECGTDIEIDGNVIINDINSLKDTDGNNIIPEAIAGKILIGNSQFGYKLETITQILNPPATGTYVLKSVNGSLSWVQEE